MISQLFVHAMHTHFSFQNRQRLLIRKKKHFIRKSFRICSQINKILVNFSQNDLSGKIIQDGSAWICMGIDIYMTNKRCMLQLYYCVLKI